MKAFFKSILAWFVALSTRSGYCPLCGESTHTMDNCHLRKD